MCQQHINALPVSSPLTGRPERGLSMPIASVYLDAVVEQESHSLRMRPTRTDEMQWGGTCAVRSVHVSACRYQELCALNVWQVAQCVVQQCGIIESGDVGDHS